MFLKNENLLFVLVAVTFLYGKLLVSTQSNSIIAVPLGAKI